LLCGLCVSAFRFGRDFPFWQTGKIQRRPKRIAVPGRLSAQRRKTLFAAKSFAFFQDGMDTLRGGQKLGVPPLGQTGSSPPSLDLFYERVILCTYRGGH
jgi:hypothetical protein